MQRLQTLTDLLKQTPEDPFLHFGVAMEYLSMHEQEKALEKMLYIMDGFPAYLPNYYLLAKQLEHFSETDKAIDVYEKGIALALELKENKTAGELRSALEELTF